MRTILTLILLAVLMAGLGHLALQAFEHEQSRANLEHEHLTQPPPSWK